MTEQNTGLPYGIIDPDYARVFTQARIIAWQYGYACLAHGSFTRDLDLLLVPWTEEARDNREQLLKLIAQAAGLRFRDGQEDVLKSKADFTIKPHGRTSCSLHFPAFGDRRWVDISFMPMLNALSSARPWRGLTEEEQASCAHPGQLLSDFARAIEAKLRELNR